MPNFILGGRGQGNTLIVMANLHKNTHSYMAVCSRSQQQLEFLVSGCQLVLAASTVYFRLVVQKRR